MLGSRSNVHGVIVGFIAFLITGREVARIFVRVVIDGPFALGLGFDYLTLLPSLGFLLGGCS